MAIILTQGDGLNLFTSTQYILTPLPNGKSLLVMTGICIPNFTSGQASGWAQEEIDIFPDFSGPVSLANLPAPPAGAVYGFQFDQYTTYGTLNSIYDAKTAVNMGFAIDNTGPILGGQPGQQTIAGIRLSVAVQDIDASLLRVGYQLMAVGNFVLVPG